MADPRRRAPAMPQDVDEKTPNAARVYDYYLGGEHNFTADRELGDKVAQAFPVIRATAMLNRAWLRRVVVDALAAGVRQFLDIGSGVPTMGNVHEIVRAVLPDGERATVVYVDYEAVAVQHSRIVLERDGATGWAAIVQEDLRHPDAILDHPDTARLIDFDRPVCLMLVSVLHFVGPDDQPDELLEAYRGRLAPGSRLAISHGTVDSLDPDDPQQGRVTALYRNSSNPTWSRSRDQIRPWFGDWPLLHYPDLVHPADWLPEPDVELTDDERAARPYMWCAVAEKAP
ncbi:MAG TPA: SAM-dependent methyltransferase [Pseudonocardiaceae bacterium]|nr:SAM-dependent methyltransferase [Pseudonocardiaceae bacterium]